MFLRLLLLLPTILFGVSQLNPWIILGCGALIILSPVLSNERPRFSVPAFLLSSIFLGLTLLDRVIQAPSVFPGWNHINWKSYVVAHDFFRPEFVVIGGDSFAFVYYYGINAIVAAVHTILPFPLQGEMALETILVFVAVAYSSIGLGFLLGTGNRFNGFGPAFWALTVLLFLPGIEVLPQVFLMLTDGSQYTLWPYWWFGFASAAQPETGWLLSWVPQHAATIFLQAFFWLRRDVSETVQFHNRCIVIAASLFTSPFFAIGWTVVFIVEFPKWYSLIKTHWISLLRSAVPLIILGLSFALFFANKTYPEHIGAALGEFSLLAILKMFLFVLVENFWLVLAAMWLIWNSRKTIQNNQIPVANNQNVFLIGGLFVGLLVLAQFRMGIYNDLYMRVSTPLIFVATFYLCQNLISCKVLFPQRLLLVAALILGLGWNLCAHFVEGQSKRVQWRSMQPEQWYVPDNGVYRQYMGASAGE